MIRTKLPPKGVPKWIKTVGLMLLFCRYMTGKAAELSNRRIALKVDEKTGAISSLKWKGNNIELVNGEAGLGLNDYFYVAGRDPKDPQRNGPVNIRIKEQGPLVASLLIESDAPGCHKLTRELRIIDGIDKEKIYKQEGVHLAFSFNVPKGVMRMDTPWAVVQPEVDQLPGSCKNYFTVQRWVDVSNRDYGVTWAKPVPKTVWLSNLAEEKASKITGPIEMAAYEIVTLRVSLPGK